MAVQAAHAACVIAAHSPGDPALWATQTIALCDVRPADLHDLIVACGGHPWQSSARTIVGAGRTSSVAWFVEPDLYWEPTAFASWDQATTDPTDLSRPDEHSIDMVDAFLKAAPLWKPNVSMTVRRWPARELGQRLDRLADPAREIWEYAAELAAQDDSAPASYATYEQRRRAAHLLVKGKEPAMT